MTRGPPRWNARPMTGRWHGLVIDTPDPRGLATFYQELLGFVRVQDDDDWVVIGDAPDRPGLASQRAPDLDRPAGRRASYRSKCISTSPWTISSRPRSRRSRWALNCSQVAAPPAASNAARQDIPSACATSRQLASRADEQLLRRQSRPRRCGAGYGIRAGVTRRCPCLGVGQVRFAEALSEGAGIRVTAMS